MYTVYKHTSPSGKIYIGITSQNINERWRNGNGYLNQVFHKAIEKYGWENIKHEVLFENLTKEQAEKKEVELISFYKSNLKMYGYNVENGGNATGKHSDETKNKIGLKHKGKTVSDESKKRMRENHADVAKEKNPNYGKKYSEERKAQMSAARKGKQVGEENPMFGKKHKQESIERMKLSRKGRCTGKNNPKARSVIQLSMNGDYIKTFDCILDVEREFKLSKGCGALISSCAKGKRKSAYGFKWKYNNGGVIANGVV